MAKTVPPFLRGFKGSKYKNTPDTIRSEDTVEVLLGVGEGENFGLADGAKSFLLGGTALINSNGEANFGDFVLRELTGVSNPQPIIPVLGGLGSPTSANVSNLARNTPVVRTGSLTQIDYIDLRFVVNQLVRSNDKGAYADTMTLKVEYRQSVPAGQPWVLGWSSSVPLPPGYDETRGPGENTYTGGGTDQEGLYEGGVVTFRGDDVIIHADTAMPSGGSGGGRVPIIWANPNQNGRPYVQEGGTWIPVGTDMGGYWRYTTGGASPTVTTFYKNSAYLTPPPNPQVGDVWTPPPETPGVRIPHRFNGTSWVIPLIGSAANAAYGRPAIGTPNGIVTLIEKITSPTVREVRLPVPRVSVPYEIRVTKTSIDSTTDGKQLSLVGWESFEEIVAEGRTFPNTHLIHLVGTASDQFTSLPELEGDIKGRIIDVPTNYDPVTRTYAGVWDGLFKKAWTDNGAWCTRDFIKNDRYGLSTLYPLEVKEASFYAWAQWCDAAVPDNKGGSRPRWTYNDSLDQPRQAKEQANYMAGSCGGRLIDDGSGVYDILIDKDEPISMVFGPESVVDGEFVYSFNDVQTRANWIKVGFVNPELNWEVDYRLVKADDFDAEPLASHIAEYGRIPMEFVATGKTNVSEALAAARLRLITGITEYTAVTFRTNRIGKYLWPFKNIGIVDPDMGWGVSGRISEKTGARQVRLRDTVFLEAGINYRFVFNRPTVPMTTATMVVAPGQTGALKTINFTADLPADLPEFAQFSLESYDAVTGAPIGLAKAFRILTITPADGDSDIVEITAMEVNRNKTAFVDGTGELLPAEEYTNFDGPVTRPFNVDVTPTIATVAGVRRRNLQIQWAKPANPFARNTIIEYSRDGNAFTVLGESSSEFYELEDVAAGTHALRLYHVSDDGTRRSLPVLVIHEVASDYRSVPPIADLQLVDEPAPPAFENISPMLRWTHGEVDVNFSHYEVTVERTVLPGADPYLPGTAWEPRLVEQVVLPEYILEFDKALAALAREDVAERLVRISVVKVDDYENKSPPTRLIIYNEAPAAPVMTLEPVIGGFNVTLSVSEERDVVGALVNLDDGAMVIEGSQSSFFIPTEAGSHTLKAAYYDRFSKTDLEWSAPQTASTATVPTGELDTTPPEPPTAVVRNTVTTLDASGNPVAMIQVSWAASVSEDTAGYQVEVVTGGRTLVRLTGNTYDEFPAAIGQGYTIRVRAYDRVSNFSTWTAAASVTPGLDTTPPLAPTSFTLATEVGGFALSWVNPVAVDLRSIKIYENTINNSAGATLVTSKVAVRSEADRIFLPYPPGTTRFFWLKAEDTSGNLSVFTAAVTGTVAAITVVTPATAVPTGLALSTSVTIQAGTGLPVPKVVATWNANLETSLAGYEVEVVEASGSPVIFPVASNRFEIEPARSGVVYAMRVRSVNTAGAKSAWSGQQSLAAGSDTVAPGAPTGLTINAAVGAFFINGLAPSDNDVAFVVPYENTTNNSATAYPLARIPVRPNQPWSVTRGATGTGTTLYYWAKAVDTSGNISGFSSGVSATIPKLGVTDFASSLTAPELMTTVQRNAATPTRGRLVLDTTDLKLYRGTGTEWTRAADGADLTLDSIDVGVLKAGAVRTRELATDAVTAIKIASREITADKMAIRTLTAMEIELNSLTGDLFSPSTYLPSTITVGPAGVSIGTLGSNYTTLLGRVDAIESDAILSKDEKPEIIRQWGDVFNERNGIYNKGTEAGLISLRDAYSTAFLNLSNYLSAMDPAWNNTAANSPFPVRPTAPFTMTEAFNAYYTARQNLYNAMVAIGFDPISRINGEPSTMIAPGKIQIFGTSSLTSLLYGPDMTRIDGGKLAANTVLANSMVIGVRGIEMTGIVFEANASGILNRVETTAGFITYLTDAGTPSAPVSIASSTYATYPGGGVTIYFFWTKGGGTIETTSNASILVNPNAVVLATYRGGSDLTQNYGRTIIDGAMIKTGTVEASVLKAGSSLNAGITLGSTGVTIGNAAAWSNDPAARINDPLAPTTKIDPGQILIQGVMTLDGWRSGTSINGGAVATNSLTADKLVLGARGIQMTGIVFEANAGGIANRVSTTGGFITYVQDNGVPSDPITVNPSLYAVYTVGTTVYFYWPKGGNFIGGTTDKAVAFAANNIVVAVYKGGTDLTVNYGQTIIEGGFIKTVDLAAISANLGTVTSGKVQNAAGTTFFDLTNGRQQFQVGAYVWRQGAIGSDVLCWFGPSGIPIGSESRTNGAFCFGTDGVIYYGSAPLETGGGDLTLTSNLGQTKGGNGLSGVIDTGTFAVVAQATLTSVTTGELINASVQWNVPGISGASFSGEIRLVDGSTVIDGPYPIYLENGSFADQVTLNGVAAGAGSRTYQIQARRTSGGTLSANASGTWSVSRMASASATSAGLMTPSQAAQLAALVAGGGGGGTIPLATPTSNGLMSAADKTAVDGISGKMDKIGATPLQVGAANDFVRVVASGGAGVPGYIDFWSDGARRGYLGFKHSSSNRLLIAVDSPWLGYEFNANPTVNGQAIFHGGNLVAATTGAQGLMSAADKTKLNGVASGATANSADGTLLNRGNHTGTQSVSTITGLGSGATKNTGASNGDLVERVSYSGTAGSITAGDLLVTRGGTQGAVFFGGPSDYIYMTSGGFQFTRGCTGPSFTPTSDNRLKKDFVDVENENSMDRVLRMQPIEFTRIADEFKARGFSAQALQIICNRYVVDPGTVRNADGSYSAGFLSIDPVAILADVVGAMQEQARRIDQLEAMVAALLANQDQPQPTET